MDVPSALYYRPAMLGKFTWDGKIDITRIKASASFNFIFINPSIEKVELIINKATIHWRPTYMTLENRKVTSWISRLIIFLCFIILNISKTSANTENITPTNIQPFEWNQGMCYCKGKLDVSKLPVESVNLIINGLADFEVTHSIPWSKLREYSKEELEKERDLYIADHNTNIEKLQALNFPQIPTLLKYKTDRIFEENLKYLLYISELNYLITNNNKHLEQELGDHNHLSQCSKYSEALNSDQSIKDALPSFAEEKCLKNSDRLACKSRLGDIEDIKSAKINILMLGWHNCVNHFYRNIREPNYEEALKSVNQFISNKTCECEDAD